MAEGWLTAYLEEGWAKAGSRAFTQLVGEGQGTTDFLMCSQHVSSPAPFCLGPGLKRHLLYFSKAMWRGSSFRRCVQLFSLRSHRSHMDSSFSMRCRIRSNRFVG